MSKKSLDQQYYEAVRSFVAERRETGTETERDAAAPILERANEPAQDKRWTTATDILKTFVDQFDHRKSVELTAQLDEHVEQIMGAAVPSRR